MASIVRRAKEASAKIRIVFRGSRYALIVDSFIRAEGPGGDKVEWSRAFGSLTPEKVMSSLPIEYIEVSSPNQSLVFKSLEELMKWAL
ncbi:MAG: hypothetical protein QXT74_03575 [Candidatus Nezhaarchaeales archaeon]